MSDEISSQFYQKTFELSKDKLIDKKDIEELEKVATTAGDRELLVDIAAHDEYAMTFNSDPAGEDESWKPKQVSFSIAANYSPSDPVAGSTPAEIVANIGQGDTLARTKSDQSRCVAAASVNAVILDGGREGFARLAKALGLPSTELTYNNVHLAQDALYRKARGGKDGSDYQEGSDRSFLHVDVRWSIDRSGKVAGGTASGQVVTAARAAGFKTEPVLFESQDSASDRRSSVESYFAKYPTGSLVLGVNKQPDGAIDNGAANHAVLVTCKDGKYYLADTWGANGKGQNLREMTQDELNSLLFNTENYILGLHH